MGLKGKLSPRNLVIKNFLVSEFLVDENWEKSERDTVKKMAAQGKERNSMLKSFAEDLDGDFDLSQE